MAARVQARTNNAGRTTDILQFGRGLATREGGYSTESHDQYAESQIKRAKRASESVNHRTSHNSRVQRVKEAQNLPRIAIQILAVNMHCLSLLGSQGDACLKRSATAV